MVNVQNVRVHIVPRGVEVTDNSYSLMDAPALHQVNGRPTAQWSRLEAGWSDDLGT